MDLCTKRFGEDVRSIVFTQDILNEDNVVLDQLSNPMIPVLNVTRSRTMTRIITDSNSCLVAFVQNCHTRKECW